MKSSDKSIRMEMSGGVIENIYNGRNILIEVRTS